MKILVSVFLSILFSANIFAEEFDSSVIINKLVKIDIVMDEPQPQDWLANHAEEGQTFEQYKVYVKDFEFDAKKVIYTQPIGKFTRNQRKIILLVSEFLELYYGFDVKIKADINQTIIGDNAIRISPLQGNKQFLAPDIIDDVMIPRIPTDAAAYVGLTAVDLWPGEGWNFVFGLATPDERVGVWSLYRMGSLERERLEYNRALVRMLKIAAHEVGHMFGLMHCINAKCLMNGTNHLFEIDRLPITLCSQCLPKISSFTKMNLPERYSQLSDWFEKNELDFLSREYLRRLELVAQES